MNTSVIRFKPLKNLDYKFLLAFLKSYFFKDQIDLLITGGAQPNFGPVHLRKINIKLPKTKEEQNAIATILSNFDLEIFGLEEKLGKYKMIKQGMMQVLLTGKIRLVRPEKLVAHESQSAKNHV
jgi:type I restriction enzyme S subunit